ncbi:hypothetical protein EC900091_2672, partial [Escherichia coli 90.0091]
MVIFAA